jgi:hypothetical protein
MLIQNIKKTSEEMEVTQTRLKKLRLQETKMSSQLWHIQSEEAGDEQVL